MAHGSDAAGSPQPIAAASVPPAWGAIADAVGHCVLVFAFAPTLAATPGWLWQEASNPLNRQDAVVLAFLPVRGLMVLLNAFVSGATQGVLAGVCAGLAMAAWWIMRGTVASTVARVLRGSACGAIGAAAMIVAILSWQAWHAGPIALPGAAVAFELASGIVCGMLAAPGACRLLVATGDLGARRPRAA